MYWLLAVTTVCAAGKAIVCKKLGANDIYLMCRKMALADAEGLEKYNGMWFEGNETEWEIMKS